LRVSLVDLKTSKIMRERTITASGVVSAVRAKGSLDPGDALTPVEKIEALRSIIRREVARVIPELVAPAPR